MDGSLSCQISSHNSHSRSVDHFLTSNGSIQVVRALQCHLYFYFCHMTLVHYTDSHTLYVFFFFNVGTQVVHVTNVSNGVYVIVLYYTHAHSKGGLILRLFWFHILSSPYSRILMYLNLSPVQ